MELQRITLTLRRHRLRPTPVKPFRIHADLAVPGDKSISHRAMLLAAVAPGESRLRGVLPGADCRSTAGALRALGVEIADPPADGGELRVRGPGVDGWRAPEAPLDCGNSGTTARLLLGLLASRPFAAQLTGDGSLRGRPMARVTDPLVEMGARVEFAGDAGRLPLRIAGGALRGIDHRSPRASAQVKSAVLLAGLTGGVAVRVVEPARSRDHTERMLASLGVSVRAAAVEGGEWEAVLRPSDAPLRPLDLRVPGDPSSAAFLLALSALADRAEVRVRDVCVNPTRAGFLRVFARMGIDVRLENPREAHGEPIADLVCAAGDLRGTVVEADEIAATIDEIPVIAALAARAAGTTRITGAAELRVKESDRIAALVSNLRAVGIAARELEDGLEVDGTDAPLTGRVITHGDHRIAMAFGVLAARPDSAIAIDDPGCVDVSFPGFWDVLRRLTGRG
jgi:3-phosphoshikimate 1-carboxyvinyltransferase